MKSITDLLNPQKARRMAVFVAVTFLLVHVMMLLLFLRYGVTPMAYFNIFIVNDNNIFTTQKNRA